MKKIFPFGCGKIAYNEKYICAGGNQIGVLERADGKSLGTITGMKNITSLTIDDDYVYVKTTIGTYAMFALDTKERKYNGYCRIKMNASHDGKFFLYEKGIILDVLRFKDENYHLVKYNFASDSYEEVCTTKLGFTKKDWRVDYAERRAYILFVETCYLNHPQTNCSIVIINIDTLQIEEELQLAFKDKTVPIGFVNNKEILLNNMQIFNIRTAKQKLLDTHNLFSDETCGYFAKMNTLSDEKLILVFSKHIFLYDVLNGTIIKDFACQYGSDAVYIDGKIYLATWDGFFLDDGEDCSKALEQ